MALRGASTPPPSGFDFASGQAKESPHERLKAAVSVEAPRFAGLLLRGAALCIDILIWFGIAMMLAISQGFLVDPLGAVERIRPWIDNVWVQALGTFYFAAFEASSWQGTPGKRALRLEVETRSAERAGFPRTLWRTVAKEISGLLFPVAIGMVLFSAERRSLHDVLAGTRVVRRSRGAVPISSATRIPWAALASVLLLAGAVLAQRYGRWLVESRQVGERIRQAYPTRLEPLPDVDAGAFFWEQHERCFEKTYALSWAWNRLDRRGYVRCLERAYGERLKRVAVLDEPAWGPHRDEPEWGKLEYTVRLQEGRLPERPGHRNVTACGGDPSDMSSSEGSGHISSFKETADGVYRTSTLAGLHERSCTLRVYVLYERWPLAEPLTVTTPTRDPVLVQAKQERQQRERQAEDRTFACIEQVMARRAKQPDVWAEPTLAKPIAALRDRDVRVREDALRELARMGGAARRAVPVLIGTLSHGYAQTNVYVIEALAAADPKGEEVVPILGCLLEKPSAQVRQAAAVALTKVGDPGGAKALAAELESPEQPTRLSAVRRLRDIAERGQPALPALLKHLAADPSADVRKECAAVLPWIDPDSGTVARGLEAARRDNDAMVRAQAEVSLPDMERVKAHRRYEAWRRTQAQE